jgi:predicted HicB family RNase H-like nuclease
MSDMMKYKGYFGSVSYSDADQVFHGKLEFIDALVTYEGTDVKSLKRAFEESVDEYIKLCRDLNKKPEKPFRGSFNVRIPVSLHQAAAKKAVMQGVSLNQIVKHALEREVTK